MARRPAPAVLITAAALLSVSPAASEDSGMTQSDGDHKYTNHLIGENSPYLLQHAHNPVDWYPWGEEALAKAKREDKPIFLSIGYAACHWCHVMERESFENEETARILNEHFVSIKVDREQRPDIDQIYMSFTMALTGNGGWPMSVFLTPDLKPFFAGTYFPPEDMMGRPGFKRVLSEIGSAYHEQKEQIVESSEEIYRQVSGFLDPGRSDTFLTHTMVGNSVAALMKTLDKTHGGFGQAPKFPHAIELSLFLRYYKQSGDLTYLNAARQALSAMARGGIYDHLGGGFARYSTDARWLVPHFEKMLYDNALLVPTYVEAYNISGDIEHLRAVTRTLDFILNEMTDSTGGFYSALDADSEGEEGKFYVWDKSEIDSILGDRAKLFCAYYNVTAEGNWEGKNILNVDAASDRARAEAGIDDFDGFIESCRSDLLSARSERVRPHTDDKILTSWNGLALSAFCRGYQATGERRFLDAAIKNASFINNELYHDGALTHSYREGKRSEGEFLEDYAFLVRGLLDLYETDLDNNERWLDFANELAHRAVELFMDADGRFYLRPDNQPDLIMRPRDETDGAIPSAGSFLIAAMVKLNRITGDAELLRSAETALRALAAQIEKYPSGMASAVMALDYYIGDKVEIVLVGDGKVRDEMAREVWQLFLPNRILAASENGDSELPLFEGRTADDHSVTAYVCRNSVCRLPVTTLDEFKKQLDGI